MPPTEDVENGNPNVVILRARARRVSTTTTLCLLVTSLIVVGIGIVGGKLLYDQYISAQMRRFRGYAQIPIPDETSNEPLFGNADGDTISDAEFLKTLHEQMERTYYDDNFRYNKHPPKKSDYNFDSLIKNYFREDFEIDMDKEDYEKIDVPDFRDGRTGRFIHDFNSNVTGIIDVTGHRCFVMPLNRDNVLPPKSLFDLIQKMWGGYYKVDTSIVRETMRVVTPPLSDLKDVGTYISKECEGKPIYKLEKYVGGVVKRSADLHVEAKFAQFSGNKITEYDIVNLEDVNKYETKNKK